MKGLKRFREISNRRQKWKGKKWNPLMRATLASQPLMTTGESYLVVRKILLRPYLLRPPDPPKGEVPLREGSRLEEAAAEDAEAFFRQASRMKDFLEDTPPSARRSLGETLSSRKVIFRLKQGTSGLRTVAAIAGSSAESRNIFWKNASHFGITSAKRGPKGLVFLCLSLTLFGGHSRSARIVNRLYRYLSERKPHGFRKQLVDSINLCRLLT